MRWWWLGAWITKVLYSPLFAPSPPHNTSNAFVSFPVPDWHQSVLCYADETADGMYGDAYVVDYVPDVPAMDLSTIVHLCLGGTVPGVVRVFHFDRVASSEILDRVQERVARRDWSSVPFPEGTWTAQQLGATESHSPSAYSLYRHNCVHFVESFLRKLKRS
jgi:hypothetical protein